MSWVDIALYFLAALVAFHFVAGTIVYFYACHLEDKRVREAEAARKEQIRQELDNRIEAMRLEKLAAYYTKQRAYAPTTVMPLVPPPPPRRNNP